MLFRLPSLALLLSLLCTSTPFRAQTTVTLTANNFTDYSISGLSSPTTFEVTSGSVRLNGILSGTGGAIKSGDGTLVLASDNTYSGGTTLSAGTLQLGSANAIGSTGTITFNGGTLQFSSNNFTDYSARFSNAANQQYTFDTNGQSVAIGAASMTSTGGSLTKLGAGTLTLTGANTYSGGLTLSAGTLRLGSANAIGSTGTITFNGGVLDPGSGDYSSRFSNAPNQRYVLDISSGSVGLSTALTSVGGSLTKLGPGTLVLNAAHTYSGGTTVSEGTLIVISDTFPTGGDVTINGGNLNLGLVATTMGAFTMSSGSLAGLHPLAATSYTFSNADALSISAVLAGSGALTKTGAGTLTLSGNNTYSGGTTISAGTLRIDGNARLPAGRAVTIAGGTLDLGAFTPTLGAFSMSAGALVASNPVTAASYAFTNEQALSLSTVFAGAGALTKTGAGTLTLSGNNTYSGGTTVSAGTLALGSASALGGGFTIDSGGTLQLAGPGGNHIADSTSVALNSGGTLDLNGRSEAIDQLAGAGTATNTAAGTTATLTLGANHGTGSFSGVLQNGAGLLALSKVGNGTLTLSGNNTFTGGTTISAGTLALEGNLTLAATGAVTIDGGTLALGAYSPNVGAVSLSSGAITGTGTLTATSFAFSNANAVTISSALAGGALTKTGAGTLTLSGTNSYTGGTTISGGTLAFDGSSSLPVARAVTVNGGTLALGTTAQSVGAFTFSAGSVTGTGTLTASAFAFSNEGSTSLSVLLDGSGALTKTGSGTLTLDGVNTYTGGTTLSAGAVAVGNAASLGTGAVQLNGGTLQASAPVTLANSILLTDDSTFAGTQALTLSGALTLTRQRELTVSNTAVTTLSGVIGQSGGTRSLLKYGTGELQLTGANTYTGGTTIAEGTVRINNLTGSAFGTGAVTVDVGATLAGAGSFTGALQLNGTYSPGNSPGAQATGSQFWAGGANYVWEINNANDALTPGAHWDFLDITGSLTLAATEGNRFTISLLSLTAGNDGGLLTGFDASQNYAYTIATASSGIFGFNSDHFTLDASGFTNSLNGGHWSIEHSGNNLNLVFTAVPEPSTYAAIAGALGLALAAWRRRRRLSDE